jgi:hypothetical protein
MAIWRVNNSTTLGNFVCAQWVANTAYALGDRVVCTLGYGTTARRAFVYECTTAGTSHAATEPTWPNTGTVADGAGDLVWTCRSPNDGTWENASCFLQYITEHASPAAGDFIYVDDGHDETLSNILTLSGSNGPEPLKVVCVNKANDLLSTGAKVGAHGVSWADALIFQKTGYMYGITINARGLGINIRPIQGYVSSWMFEGASNNTILFTGTFAVIFDPKIYVSNYYIQGGPAKLVMRNGSVSFGANGAFANQSVLILENIKLNNEVNNLFLEEKYSHTIVRDCDLSGLCTGATNRYLISSSGDNEGYLWAPVYLFERCKLPSGAGFGIHSGTLNVRSAAGAIKLHHCSKDNKIYDFEEHYYYGFIKDETTIVKTDGASDGTTPISILMTSNGNTGYPLNCLISPDIHGWASLATTQSFTIEGICDSETNLQNDEIWMELEYPENDTDGLGFSSKDMCEILGTPEDKTVSEVEWTTTGITNVNKFKLSVIVTPGKVGPITARVCLAKPSTTVYIDPMITQEATVG